MTKLILLLMSLLVGVTSFSQTNEAYFKFNIEVTPVVKSEEAMATARMLRFSEMLIYFDKNHSRVEFKLGKVSTTTVVVNTLINEGLSFSTGSMGNIATTGTAKDFTATKPDNTAMRSSVKAHDEFRTILGFKCQKYTLNDGQFSATYWCTDEIVISPEINSSFNKDLPSFPLAFSTVSNGLRMEYQASDYSFQLEDKKTLFSTDVPAGFQLMKSK
jgi:hypothetical protein